MKFALPPALNGWQGRREKPNAGGIVALYQRFIQIGWAVSECANQAISSGRHPNGLGGE